MSRSEPELMAVWWEERSQWEIWDMRTANLVGHFDTLIGAVRDLGLEPRDIVIDIATHKENPDP